jgi:molybdopterin-synthase adenylyltransferase
MLSEEEVLRYDRQIIVRGIGEEGQHKLKEAKVVVAGSGELGAPASLYLAAAGVGKIRIVDDGAVELENLNRHVLHWSQDVGRNKADSLVEKLRQLNDKIEIEPITAPVTEDNVMRLVSGFDFVLEATDDLQSGLLWNCAAVHTGTAMVHGAVYGFEGRITTVIPGKTPCVGCLYRGTSLQRKSPAIGVTAAVIGSLQATEAIKYILGVGHLLTNRLLVYNALRMRFGSLAIKKDPNCRFCGDTARTAASD